MPLLDAADSVSPRMNRRPCSCSVSNAIAACMRVRLSGRSANDASLVKSWFIETRRSAMKSGGIWSPMMLVASFAAGKNVVRSHQALNACTRLRIQRRLGMAPVDLAQDQQRITVDVGADLQHRRPAIALPSAARDQAWVPSSAFPPNARRAAYYRKQAGPFRNTARSRSGAGYNRPQFFLPDTFAVSSFRLAPGRSRRRGPPARRRPPPQAANAVSWSITSAPAFKRGISSFPYSLASFSGSKPRIRNEPTPIR